MLVVADKGWSDVIDCGLLHVAGFEKQTETVVGTGGSHGLSEVVAAHEVGSLVVDDSKKRAVGRLNDVVHSLLFFRYIHYLF